MVSAALPVYAGDGTGERRVPELQRPQADRSRAHHLDDRQLQAQQGEIACSLQTLTNSLKNAIKRCYKKFPRHYLWNTFPLIFYNIQKTLRNKNLKGQCHKIFASDFFHESVSRSPRVSH